MTPEGRPGLPAAPPELSKSTYLSNDVFGDQIGMALRVELPKLVNGDVTVPYLLGLWYAALIDFNRIIGKFVIKLKISGEQTREGVCTCWPECPHKMRVTMLENSAQNVMVNLKI